MNTTITIGAGILLILGICAAILLIYLIFMSVCRVI